ncbi:MAG: hypothetical protein F6K23_14430 [Okeania sp. SIO2C9]|uniref:hypothetical protein n=1 Tax=Okeania sp. SIO2C9 TaxID=2607791 RepID=UPI0013C0F673|nr:hypothetical protein [Okeania sp. SIO2C9]NEQ74130.1 hypothetical protein [Okeania sp. SIO2C9]
MSKEKDGTQSKSRSSRGSEGYGRIQSNSNEHTSGQEASEERTDKSIGGSGETDSREPSIESIRQTFFEFTGKILRGLLDKSQNDKRVWEDRLQEAKDCIEWYQDLLGKCEKEISIADAQISEVEVMLTQLEQE